MRLHGIAAAAAALAIAGSGWAQVAPKPAAPPAGPGAGYSVCKEAALEIDDSLKEAGYIKAQAIGDDSAPRATMRAAQISAHMAAIQANLTLMVANRCALPELPISDSVYFGSAVGCALAREEQDIKAKCARGSWEPGPRWSAAKRPR